MKNLKIWKNNSTYIIISILVLSVILIGTTFAWFLYTTGQSNNGTTVTSGTLVINYTDGTIIGADGLVPALEPLYNAECGEGACYKNSFTVSNTGTLDAIMNGLLEVSENTFESGKLMYKVMDGENLVYPATSITGNSVILFEELSLTASTGTKTYTLFIWLDSSATNASQNKSMTGTIKVAGVQTGLPSGADIFTISGFVYDEDGNPISNASILVQSDPINSSTNSLGYYELGNVPAGNHTITVMDENQNQIIRDTFTIQKGEETLVNGKVITLKPKEILFNIVKSSDNKIDTVTVEPKKLEVVRVQGYGGNGSDYYTSTTSSYDSNGVIDGYMSVGYAGSTNIGFTSKGSWDAILVKYNLNDEMQWVKNYGGSSTDHFYSVTPSYGSNSKVDGYVAVGISDSTNAGFTNNGGRDAIIVKYDVSGNEVWSKNFGGSGSDYFQSVTSSYNSSGEMDGYIVVGYSDSTDLGFTNAGSNDGIIVKYDLSGNVVWTKNVGGTNAEIFHSINISYNSSGNIDGYVIVGQSNSTDLGFTNKGYNDGIIVKYDLNGNQTWLKSYGGGSDDIFRSVTQAKTETGAYDGYIVVGNSSSNRTGWTNKGEPDAIITKFDLSGNIVWDKGFGGNGNDMFMSLSNSYNETGKIDGYIAVGQSGSSNANFTNKGGRDVVIVKYKLDGETVDVSSFGGSGDDYLDSVFSYQNASGKFVGYIAVGRSHSSNAGFVSKGGVDGMTVHIK